MKLEIIEKNYDVGKRLQSLIEKKVGKLGRYFKDDAVCKVACKEDNKRFKLEITITGKGCFFRSEVVGDNMYDNLDVALPKIEKQILKFSGKKNDSYKAVTLPELLFVSELPEEEYKKKITKRKTFSLDPITEEDAIYMLETTDHDFYVFLNAETGLVSILYRKGGVDQYGLIEVKK